MDGVHIHQICKTKQNKPNQAKGIIITIEQE
jgi:hypothetical protein